jgi:hypothetical protein
MGYPCGHDLQQRLVAGEPVPLSSVHRHWHFEPLRAEQLHQPTVPIIRAPQMRQRGRQNMSEASSEASDTGDESAGSPSDGVEHDNSLSQPRLSARAERTTDRAGRQPAAQSL